MEVVAIKIMSYANFQEQDKKKIRNRIAITIVVVGAIFSFLIFWPRDNSPSETANADEILMEVETIVLAQNNYGTAPITKTATLEMVSSTDILAQYSGRIKEIKVRIGEKVVEDQTIAVFNQSNLENSPKLSFESAQNSFKLAKKNLKNTKEVADESLELADTAVEIAELQLEQAQESGDDSAIDLARKNLEIAEDQEDQAKESAKLQTNGAKLQLEQAQLALNQAKLAYDKTFLKAPVSGVLASLDISENQFLNMNQRAGYIVGEGDLEAKLFLDAEEIERVSESDLVEIKIDNQVVKGEISALSRVANNDNERFEVRVRVLETKPELANKTVKITLNLRLHSEANGFFVPLKAIALGQKGAKVFVVEDGVAKEREVEIGEIVGAQVEVIEWLNVGEEVIVEGSRGLSEDEKVSVVNKVE